MFPFSLKFLLMVQIMALKLVCVGINWKACQNTDCQAPSTELLRICFSNKSLVNVDSLRTLLFEKYWYKYVY